MKKILSIALLFAGIQASAQTAEFDRVVSSVMDSLTNISTLSRGFRSEVMALEAENRLSGPEAGFEYKWPQQRGAENRWGIELTQEFEWPGIYGARRRAASELRQLAAESTEQSRQWLRYEVSDRLLQLIEARQRLDLLSEVEANLSQVVDRLTEMLAGGQTTVLDLRKAEFELLAVKEKIASAQADSNRLRASIAFGQFIPEGIDELTEFPEHGLEIPQDGPEEIEATAEAARSRLRAQIEQMKRMPSFSVGYLHDFEEGVHFNGLSIGITLPDFGAGKSAKAAELEAETAQMKREEARAMRNVEVAANIAEAARLTTVLAEYDKALSQSDYLRLLKKSFDAGQITLTQYLLDQNWYLTTRLDHLALRLRLLRLSA